MAAGQAASYVVGVVVCTRVLATRVPRDLDGRVLQTALRCLLAALLPAVAAALVVAATGSQLGTGLVGAVVATGLGGLVLVAGYAAVARWAGVPEVDALTRPVLARLSR